MMRFLGSCFVWLGMIAVCLGQELEIPAGSNNAKQHASTESGAEQSEVRSIWTFGLEVQCTGQAQAVTGAFPIPIDWPEQTVTVAKPEHTQNVSKITTKDLGTAKMVEFEIARMAPGDVASCTVECVVVKRRINAPESVERLTLINPKTIGSGKLDKEQAAKMKEVKLSLRPAPHVESTNAMIVQLAKDSFADDGETKAWQQVEAIYDWVRDNIEYRLEETNRPAIESLKNKRGDCGEMTGLFVALCRARGIPARTVWIPHHAYPEFYLQDEQGQGHWLPCQVAGSRAFGSLMDDRPILQKGDSYQLRGQKQPVRFVQPSLTAKQATAPLQIKFIMQKANVQ